MRLIELNSAKKPLIIVGNGVKAAKSIEAFEKYCYVAAYSGVLTWPTLDFLPFDHELNMAGLVTSPKVL